MSPSLIKEGEAAKTQRAFEKRCPSAEGPEDIGGVPQSLFNFRRGEEHHTEQNEGVKPPKDLVEILHSVQNDRA